MRSTRGVDADVIRRSVQSIAMRGVAAKSLFHPFGLGKIARVDQHARPVEFVGR
jgi:hypothetical protein